MASILCFHHNDLDGIFAAAVVRKAYKETDEVTFRKVNYDYNFEKEMAVIGLYDKCVIVDFSFTPECMQILHKKFGKELTWIDHHVTAKEKNPELWNNKDIRGLRSERWAGCYLAWQYYFGGGVPTAIKLIDDLDRWQWKYKETKSFIEYADIAIRFPKDVEKYFTFEESDDKVDSWIEQFMDYGSILLESKDKRIKRSFEGGKDGIFEGFKTRFINTNFDISQVGHYSCKDKDYDVAFIWFVRGTNVIACLRSTTQDVSKIAVKFGGGGHPGASGFNTTIEQMKEWIQNGS